ncbi:hypothetical protein RUND412_007194 [Rhizina undulata]
MMSAGDEKLPHLASTQTTILDTASNYTASSTYTANTLVNPTYVYKTLKITNIATITCPFASNHETSILDSDGNTLYTSRRLAKCSGTSVLSSPQNPHISKTTYTLLHSPVISFSPPETSTYSQEDIKFSGKGVFTRAQTFTTLDKQGKRLEWEWGYVKRQLVLTRKDVGEVARLDRKRCAKEAMLMVREDVEGVGEVLVIITALVMLKKEADRKAAAIAVAVS